MLRIAASLIGTFAASTLMAAAAVGQPAVTHPAVASGAPAPVLAQAQSKGFEPASDRDYEGVRRTYRLIGQ